MDQRQPNLRHIAAKEFMQSLDELQDILQKERQASAEQASHSDPKQPQTSELPPNSLQALEQAAADIEQFFNNSAEL